MKTLSQVVLITFILLSFNSLFSQEDCKVLKEELIGKYDGKCKNGLANGKGTAVGKDTYRGRFKDGLPDGNGKYTWSTGEVYDGYWKEGLREGSGKYTYKKDGVDSVKYGIWEKDLFLKEIASDPYKLIRKNGISNYNVRRIGDGNSLEIKIMKNGNQNYDYYNLSIFSSSGTNKSGS